MESENHKESLDWTSETMESNIPPTEGFLKPSGLVLFLPLLMGRMTSGR